jgi:hypothetical protein
VAVRLDTCQVARMRGKEPPGGGAGIFCFFGARELASKAIATGVASCETGHLGKGVEGVGWAGWKGASPSVQSKGWEAALAGTARARQHQGMASLVGWPHKGATACCRRWLQCSTR